MKTTVSLLLFVSAIAGQTTGGFLPRVPMAYTPDRPVVIDVAAAPLSRWVLAVRVDSQTSPCFAVGLGQDVLSASGSHVPTLHPLAEAQYSAGLNNIVLRPTAGVLLLYISVPQPTKIQVTVDGRSVVSTDVADSLLLENGAVVDAPVRGFRDVLKRVLFTRPKVASLARMADGRIYASETAVREHLINADAIPALKNADHAKVAFVSVDILADGTVRPIRSTGDGVVAQKAASLVASMRFRPFEMDSAKTDVRAMLMFASDRNGIVGLVW